MVTRAKPPHRPTPHPGPLPFEPQDNETLARRFVAALAETRKIPDLTNPANVAEMMQAKSPGQFRKHVFDHVTGLRVVMNMELLYRATEPFIHFSASLQTGDCDAAGGLRTAIQEALEILPEMFKGTPVQHLVSHFATYNFMGFAVQMLVDRLAGFAVPLRCLGDSPNLAESGVIHFTGPSPDEYNALARKAGAAEIPSE